MAAYVVFFAGMFLLLLLADKSRLGKASADQLHASSFSSGVYMPRHTGLGKSLSSLEANPGPEHGWAEFGSKRQLGDAAEGHSRLLRHLLLENERRRREYDALLQEQLQHSHVGDAAALDLYSAAAGGDSSAQQAVDPLGSVSAKQNGDKTSERFFDSEFQDYLLLKRCYLGCGPVLFSDGLHVPLLGLHLRPGLAENFLVHLMNNHAIAGCVYACKQSSHSRNSRRLVFVVVNTLAFFISTLSAVIFARIGLGSVYSQATAQPATSFVFNRCIDIFIVSPVSLVVGGLLQKSYRCNITVLDVENNPQYVARVRRLKKFVVMPALLLACSVLLILCSALTTGADSMGNINGFLLQVLLVTVVLDSIFIALNFVSTHHYAVYLFGGRLCVLSVGQLYLELLIDGGKLKDVDYVDTRHSALRGLVVIERVVDRVAYLKSGREHRNSRQDSFLHVNPMHARRTLSLRQAPAWSAADVSNPLHARAGSVEMSALPGGELKQRQSDESGSSQEGADPPVLEAPPSSAAAATAAAATAAPVSEPSGPSLAQQLLVRHRSLWHRAQRNSEGAVAPLSLGVSSEAAASGEEEGEEEDPSGEGAQALPSRLMGKRNSFIQKIVFYEQEAKSKGRVELKRSMVADRPPSQRPSAQSIPEEDQIFQL